MSKELKTQSAQGREGERPRRSKGRNEETCAAEPPRRKLLGGNTHTATHRNNNSWRKNPIPGRRAGANDGRQRTGAWRGGLEATKGGPEQHPGRKAPTCEWEKHKHTQEKAERQGRNTLSRKRNAKTRIRKTKKIYTVQQIPNPCHAEGENPNHIKITKPNLDGGPTRGGSE